MSTKTSVSLYIIFSYKNITDVFTFLEKDNFYSKIIHTCHSKLYHSDNECKKIVRFHKQNQVKNKIYVNR